MAETNALTAAFEEAMKSGDFNRVGETLQQYATDDFVDEYPQSGERLSKAAMTRMAETYGQATGTSPTFSYKRMLGGGDIFVVEGTIDYGDGVPVRYVGIGEVRDGKVAKMTEYFANPFDAPAWRADFVERMQPTTA